MKRLCGLACLAAFAGGSFAVHAQPLRIDGLDPLSPLQLQEVVPALDGKVLEIRGNDGERLRVQPWPAALPQRFAPQKVEAQRRLLPAGPSDRITFFRPGRKSPWLVVGSGSRSGTPLVGEWRLGFRDGKWEAVSGSRVLHLQGGGAIRVKIDGRCWRIHLLDAGKARQRNGIADEAEPQASWAALRTTSRRSEAAD